MNHVATSEFRTGVRHNRRSKTISLILGAGVVLFAAVLSSEIGVGSAVAVAATPTVTGVSPVSGIATGGTTVTVTGTNLTGASAVDFGVTAGSSVSVNPNGTSLTVNAPANPNTGTAFGSTFDITLTTPGGTSSTSKLDRYTYEYDTSACGASPFTTSCAATISAQETAPGTGAVVSATAGGADLLQVPLNATVTLTPDDPGTGPSGGNFSLSTLDVSTTPPTIEDNQHASATYTVPVTDPTPGQPYSARFLAEADHCPTAPTFPSPPTVSCPLTPTGGNSDPVIVEWGAPTVTSVSPSAGSTAGGTSVTITGSGLTGVTAVNFGSTAATGVTVNSDTSVTATSPLAPRGRSMSWCRTLRR